VGDLEAILGNEVSSLTRDLFDPELSEEQRRERIERSGLLLEQRKLQFEEWEKSSPQFIGHDEYYRQEVDRAQVLGRFIRPEDLANFVIDFLSHYDKRSEIFEDGPGIYCLKASEKLVQFVIGQPEDSQKAGFCGRLQLDSMQLTFDSEVAERQRELTFVHVRHFFIRAIVNEYSQADSHFHPIARLQMAPSHDLPAGDYLYLVARATIRAAREYDALLPIVVNLQSLEAIDEDDAEHCLGRMVGEGTDIQVPDFDATAIDRALETAESILAERFQLRRDGIERLNQAFVDARLASVQESYRLKIQRKNNLLERAQAANQQRSYIRMLEGGIRNLKAERESRESGIERLRSLTAEHALTAAGILQVREPRD
jgi:hypothetical protein